jgi:putative spermidine/putrescine transport system ATP-binding protein
VEYQGPVVRVALETEDGESISAVLPDDTYYANPVNPGEAVTLVWSPTDMHALSE